MSLLEAIIIPPLILLFIWGAVTVWSRIAEFLSTRFNIDPLYIDLGVCGMLVWALISVALYKSKL